MAHILIVEDDIAISEMLVDMLEEHGFTCSTANDGLEGIRRALDLMPDLVVVDLSLPSCSGLEVIEHLKSSGATSHVPIIAVSAMNDLLRAASRYDISAAIAKPFEIEQLLGDITRLTNASH